MPVTPAGGSPYPSVEDVMNLARVRVNDTAFGIEGDLLSDDKPYTLTMLNAAWRWLQRKAANAGIEMPKKNVFLFGLPGSQSQDLINENFVGWMGCGNGLIEQESPALPGDLLLPLSVWIRQNGTQDQFLPMRQADNGLPTFLDNYVYDYRDDQIYYYGSAYSIDMRIRYAATRPNLILGVDDAIVPMVDSQDALSARIAYEFCNARGANAAPVLQQMADTAFETMSHSTGRRKGRMSIRRQPYSRRGGSYGWPQIRGY